MTHEITAYRALALQLTCQAVNACADRAEARARMLANVGRIERAVAGEVAD